MDKSILYLLIFQEGDNFSYKTARNVLIFKAFQKDKNDFYCIFFSYLLQLQNNIVY